MRGFQMINSNSFTIGCIISTICNISLGYLLSPISSKAIFKDTIGFVNNLKYNFNLSIKEFKSILPLLEKREYELLPPIKYVPCDIKNTPSLRNSLFIQRDCESVVNTSNFIWDHSSADLNTYAQKSFDYVLNDIKYNLAPEQSAYGTNFYKAGTCYGKLNLFAALCRRKGIETKFKIIPFKLSQGFEDLFLEFVPDELEFLNEWFIKFLYVKIPHHFLEIRLDNCWYEASPIQPGFFYGMLNITSPGVDKERRVKAEFVKKKGHVKPIYTNEIYPLFTIGGAELGKLKLADSVNNKINKISKI